LETTEEKRECLPKTQKRHSTMHDGPQIDRNRPSSPHSAESEQNGGAQVPRLATKKNDSYEY
jgi:hypothetical protein